MKIYLLRHGDALPLGSPGVKTDDDRPLSDDGIDDIRTAALALRKLGVDPDAVLSSPLLRARQTADLVAREFNLENVGLWDEIGHGFSPPALLEKLRELDPDTAVILTGHQPDFGDFASFLVFGKSGADIAFKKAGVCLVEFEKRPAAGKGTLAWLLTRKHLSRIAS